MLAFTWTVRMTGAGTGGQRYQVVEFMPAVLAGILALFRAFIKSMFTSSWPIRMAWTGAGRKAANVIKFMSAIDAVKIRHNYIFYKGFIVIVYTQSIHEKGFC